MPVSAFALSLTPLLTDPAWRELSLLLWAGFLILFGLQCRHCLRRPALPPSSSADRVVSLRLLELAMLGGMLLLAARQAGWQLLGQRHPAFISFMQRYDRREFNPAHQLRAGRITDRHGQVLAHSPAAAPGGKRHYPFGPVFSHVIGYNHPLYGMTGVESASRRNLLGFGAGNQEKWMEIGSELWNPAGRGEGPAVRTSLDANLQRRAAALMRGRAGAVVVMDIRNGELLVLLSQPDFDPNAVSGQLFSGGERQARLMNRALAGMYPPGSVFKVLIAAALLREGKDGAVFDTPAAGFTTSAGNPPIRDHDFYRAQEKGEIWRGRGRIGLSDALTFSSNVYFARAGATLGAEPLWQTLRAAGLSRTFSLWPGDESTLQSRPARHAPFAEAGAYELAQLSIGQGELLVSPLHIAMIFSGIANRGLVPKPKLDPAQPTEWLGRLCSPEAADRLKWMLHRVVREGTGRGIAMPELAVAGKTGTAQTGGGRASHSWFAGLAPVSDPRWAFCVLVEHGGYGSATALPIARDLLRDGIREGWLRP